MTLTTTSVFVGNADGPQVSKIVGPDGFPRWLQVQRQPLDIPGQQGLDLWVAVDVTEQHLAQEAQSESEAFLRTIIDSIPSSVYVKDGQGKHLIANRELGRFFGVPSKDILGLDDQELLTVAGFPMANLQLFDAQDRQVRDSGQPLNVAQETVLMPDGACRWFEVRKMPLTWRGQTGLVLGVATDITDRIKAAEALEESEAVLRQVVDTTPSMIYVKDPHGRYVLVNRTYADTYGLKPERLLGRTDLDFCDELGIPREQALEYRKQDEYVRQTGQQFSISAELHHSPGGRTCWLAIVKTPLKLKGESGHVLGVSHDVSVRRRAMSALRANEALLRAVIDADPNHVFLMDPEGRFVLANRAKAESYGLKPHDLVGATEAELCARMGLDMDQVSVHADSDASARHAKGLIHVPEHCHFFSDGREVWLEGIKRAISWRDKPGYILGVMMDVTLRRQLEEQLRQAAKMEAIGRLAGGIAHDFNNLLTVINGYAGLMMANCDPQDSQRGDVGQILEAGYRAADLTKRLLTFSRPQAIEVVPCDVGRIIEQMARMLLRIIGEDVELVLDLADELDLVEADPAQIEQMIVNLAVNARDAMPQGGTLSLRTEAVTLAAGDTLSHLDADPGAYVAIRVSDHGQGMDDTVLEHLFEPFFTTKEVGKGTGLGLAMVYGIVSRGGGGIDIASRVGKGTVVSVLLPSSGAASALHRVTREASPPPRGSEAILVIEDQPRVAGIVRRLLDGLGYRVMTVGGSAQALALPWQKVEADLILADVLMPGLNGPELVASLRKRGVDRPIVYMSGHPADLVTTWGDTPEYLITKPIDADELARTIRRALDGVPPATLG